MSKLLLEMEVHAYAEPIRVRVEYDDGPVAYAEIDALPGHHPERCYVTTIERTAKWEYGTEDGDWRRAVRSQVTHEEDVRKAMERAARAGLVAAGYAS